MGQASSQITPANSPARQSSAGQKLAGEQKGSVVNQKSKPEILKTHNRSHLVQAENSSDPSPQPTSKKTKRPKPKDPPSKVNKSSARKCQSTEGADTNCGPTAAASRSLASGTLSSVPPASEPSHDNEASHGKRKAKKRKRTKSRSGDSVRDAKSSLAVSDTQPTDRVKSSKRRRLVDETVDNSGRKKPRKDRSTSTEKLSACTIADASDSLEGNEASPGQTSSREYAIAKEGAVHSNPRRSTSQQDRSEDRIEAGTKLHSQPQISKSGRTSKALSSRKTPKEASRAQSTTAQNGDGLAIPTSDAKLGLFTTHEKQIADRIFDEVRNEEGLTSTAMNEKIQKWSTVGRFKTEILGAFPTRPRPSLRKFCQRRYHNLDRGAWVEDQDAMLRNAYAQFPDRWTKISGMVGRTTADCRDRWRHHLQYGNGKQSGPWSTEEEELLERLVSQCVDKTEQENQKGAGRTQDVERLHAIVNWEWVSQQHGSHRSAKQCREKHRNLQIRDTRIAQLESLGQSASRTSHKAKSKVEHTRSEKRAMKALKRFGLGDYYDVFVEIHSSFPDHTSVFHDEARVVWEIISQKHPGSKFGAGGMHGTLRRIAFEEALTKWTPPSKAIEKTLKKAPSIAAKALILANWLDTEDSEGTRAREYVPKPTGKGTRRNGKPQLSNARVESSSDEDSTGEPEA